MLRGQVGEDVLDPALKLENQKEHGIKITTQRCFQKKKIYYEKDSLTCWETHFLSESQTRRRMCESVHIYKSDITHTGWGTVTQLVLLR